MSAKPTLHYFPAKGRAEAARLAFALAGIEFEDHRFPGEQWPALKQTTPLGGAPWLTMGDLTLCQSNALLWYASRRGGLIPEDPFLEAKGACFGVVSVAGGLFIFLFTNFLKSAGAVRVA